MPAMTWSEKMVIQSAGICLEDTDERIVALAGVALERYYYVQHAAEWLMRRLQVSY
jgi:hypothetical protein